MPNFLVIIRNAPKREIQDIFMNLSCIPKFVKIGRINNPGYENYIFYKNRRFCRRRPLDFYNLTRENDVYEFLSFASRCRYGYGQGYLFSSKIYEIIHDYIDIVEYKESFSIEGDNENDVTDAVINVYDRENNLLTLKLHKTILSRYSDYFYAAFKYDSIINLYDTDHSTFQQIVDLLYGNEMTIDGLNTLKLLIMVKYFQIKNIDITKIAPMIFIRKASRFNQAVFNDYIMLLSELYPEGFDEEIIKTIKMNVGVDTDLSLLSDELISYIKT